LLGLFSNGTQGKDRRERFILYRRKGEIVLSAVLALIVAAIIYVVLSF
jgi:hypothetical protein